VLRPIFRQNQVVFERGIELLADAGLTDAQIDAIADAPITPSTADVNEITGDLEPTITDDELTEIANTFLSAVEGLDFLELNEKQNRALDRSATECGVLPSTSYDCTDLLPATEAEALLGGEVTLGDDGCAYTGPEPFEGRTPEIEVVVYDSARALEFLTGALDEVEEVRGIGDAAVAIEGFSANGRTITCGRTLHVADGDHTVVVALCLGGDEPPVSNDQLAQIADFVLERVA
jgi:hypothetical protein